MPTITGPATNPHLVANVLTLAATAVEHLPNLAVTQAVMVAMDVAGSSDPYVFADALGAIAGQPEAAGQTRRHERMRAAAHALRANVRTPNGEDSAMAKELDRIVHEGEIVDDCERCGKPGRLVAEPFEQDVNNRTVMVVLCDDCYGQIADEI
jgi:hypothetical protein